MKNDYSKTIRIPRSWNQFIQDFSIKFDLPSSYVYRCAIREYIKSKGFAQGVMR